MIRHRSNKLALSLALISCVALTGISARAGQVQNVWHGPLPMAQLPSSVADAYTLPAPPIGQSAIERADWMLNQNAVVGRAPMDWVRWANETYTLEAPPARTVARGDLSANVLRLYAALGLPTAVARPAIDAAAADLPEALRAPFAEVVGVVADAYDAQLPIAANVLARMADGMDVKEVFLTPMERDQMAASQARILGAIALFRARTGDVLARTSVNAGAAPDAPLFTDPEGLVILGGTGDTTYTRAGMFPDPILLVEPSGNDTYRNSAGGACPVTPEIFGTWLECNSLVVSVVADLGETGSNDTYSYDGAPSAVQGAGGPGGLGMLIDAGGNDSYFAKMTRGNVSPFDLTYYFDGGAQGYGYGGNGLLLDNAGDDTYRFDILSTSGYSIWALGQGFGGAGGLGIASDVSGNDDWLSNGLGLPLVNNKARGFEGIYTIGSGFYGGVGIASDTGAGDDFYSAKVTATSVDFYAVGFGAFGGLGAFYEDGGDDDYYTYERATTSTTLIDPLLNCAYGTASYAGVGAMVEVGGNDTYYGASISPRGSEVMDHGFGGPGVGYGVFTDTGGNDRYEMYGEGTTVMLVGRGEYDSPDTNTFGSFADIGGDDTYIGGTPRTDNTQWTLGVDQDVP